MRLNSLSLYGARIFPYRPTAAFLNMKLERTNRGFKARGGVRAPVPEKLFRKEPPAAWNLRIQRASSFQLWASAAKAPTCEGKPRGEGGLHGGRGGRGTGSLLPAQFLPPLFDHLQGAL